MNAKYLLIILFLILSLYFIYPEKKSREDFLNYMKCSRRSNNNVTQEIFNKYNFNRTRDKNWDLYIPCGYNDVEEEMKTIKVSNNRQIIFGISGCDKIVAKDYIWKLLMNKYGRLRSKELMPDTYIVKNVSDRQLFYQNYNPNNIYILKKNIQRQQGLKLLNKLDDINNETGLFSNYKVIQELLQDPFVLNGRKINLRIYLLLICEKDNISAYIHEGGFMYYTPKYFKKNSLKTECNITSGYVPRKIYRENPLTLIDFKKWLEKNGYNSRLLFQNIEKMFQIIMNAIADPLCNKTLKNNIKFQLFGADVAPDENLKSKLMEINKGPDMGAKDKRDKKIKLTVQEDIYQLLGLINTGRKNGFKQIWKRYY
jgi:hypothetical protein